MQGEALRRAQRREQLVLHPWRRLGRRASAPLSPSGVRETTRRRRSCGSRSRRTTPFASAASIRRTMSAGSLRSRSPSALWDDGPCSFSEPREERELVQRDLAGEPAARLASAHRQQVAGQVLEHCWSIPTIGTLQQCLTLTSLACTARELRRLVGGNRAPRTFAVVRGRHGGRGGVLRRRGGRVRAGAGLPELRRADRARRVLGRRRRGAVALVRQHRLSRPRRPRGAGSRATRSSLERTSPRGTNRTTFTVAADRLVQRVEFDGAVVAEASYRRGA